MKNHLSPEELLELESQASCPHGKKGVEMGESMNVGNRSMIDAGIEALQLEDNNSILEIGHGNCGHLSRILAKANKLSYMGLELSETMRKEAIRINQDVSEANKVEFRLYKATEFPFEDDSFQRILSVNSIYFWKDINQVFREIKRVLSPQGFISIVYAQKEYMKKLPFAKKKFTLYNNEDLNQIAINADLDILGFFDYSERVKSKRGGFVVRDFSVVTMRK